jgi:hypothetical protein
MNIVLLLVSSVLILLGVAFLFVLKTLISGNRNTALPADWENIFAPSRYKPMQRLLDPADSKYLAMQPACGRRLTRRFRANRVSIFRGYARCLARDFARVSHALRVVMVHAPVDRSALAALLVRQQLLFSFTMVSLEAKLTLHQLGWTSPTGDIRNLVGALDTLRIQLRALSLTAQTSAAAA